MKKLLVTLSVIPAKAGIQTEKAWPRPTPGWRRKKNQVSYEDEGRQLRTLYAFDPRRKAILLIGGDKSGDDRWYETHVPIADQLYDEHLEEIRYG